MNKKSADWIQSWFVIMLVAMTAACSADLPGTGPNTDMHSPVMEVWVSDTAAPRLRAIDVSSRGKDIAGQAWARARLANANPSQPEYAVTQDQLPQGAAAKVLRGGESGVRLIVVTEEQLTDDVLQVARAALALDEIGAFGGDGILSGAQSRSLLILADGTILVPSQTGAWRRISPLPISPSAANRSRANNSSRRLLQAVRHSGVESVGGVSVRRAAHVML